MIDSHTQTAFERALEHVLASEGGYVNDPNDRGGETKYGITIGVARAWGYTGPMSQLPLDVAKVIYKKQYWDALRLDEVALRSEAIARELFDTCVNMGQSYAARFFQTSLNAFNDRSRHYADIIEDGSVGPATISAFNAYMRKRGHLAERVMLSALDSLQCTRYIDLSRARQQNETFVFGWIANRIGK